MKRREEHDRRAVRVPRAGIARSSRAGNEDGDGEAGGREAEQPRGAHLPTLHPDQCRRSRLPDAPECDGHRLTVDAGRAVGAQEDDHLRHLARRQHAPGRIRGGRSVHTWSVVMPRRRPPPGPTAPPSRCAPSRAGRRSTGRRTGRRPWRRPASTEQAVLGPGVGAACVLRHLAGSRAGVDDAATTRSTIPRTTSRESSNGASRCPPSSRSTPRDPPPDHPFVRRPEPWLTTSTSIAPSRRSVSVTTAAHPPAARDRQPHSRGRPRPVPARCGVIMTRARPPRGGAPPLGRSRDRLR